tara:strand:- start:804 stop:1316 length:513 start_codon:yes stop_codon:yes gene_type:complete
MTEKPQEQGKDLVEWLIESRMTKDQPNACPECGETETGVTFMRFDCLNPGCKHFAEYLATDWLNNLVYAEPQWGRISRETHVDLTKKWTQTKYLGLYINREEGVVWDLWYAEWWGGKMLVANAATGGRDQIDLEHADGYLADENTRRYKPQVINLINRWKFSVRFRELDL